MEEFEKSCAIMEENHVADPKGLTDYVFYFRHKHIAENNKKNKGTGI
jgi:hypothetical protein